MSRAVYPAKFAAYVSGRHPKLVLPWVLYLSELPENYSAVVLGQFQGLSSGGSPVIFEAVVVTLPSGVEVPAYRGVGVDCAVCQNFMFFPAK